MADGYALLSRKITRSSLWVNHGHVVRSIWASLLSLADHDGVVWGSDAMIAADCIATREDFDRALSVLLAPDPESASVEEEGRRLIRITSPKRGFRIVTWDAYQAAWSYDAKREAEADRKRRQREKTKNQQVTEQMSHDGRDMSRPVPICSLPTLPNPTKTNPTHPPKSPNGGASKDVKTTLPDDWAPTEDCIARIVKGSDQAKGCTSAFASMCLDRFADYYTTAGKGGSERRTAQKWQDRFKLWVWDNWKRAEGEDYRRANGISAPKPKQTMDF